MKDKGKLNSSGDKMQQVWYQDFKNKDFLSYTVRQCQNGDAGAMENVYVAYKSSIFKLTCRFTGDYAQAEDLLQDIFIKIFTNIKRLRSPEAFNTWLYRIAVNTCMSFARKNRRSKEVSINELDNAGVSEDGENMDRQEIEKAMDTLPPKQKMVFQLHDIQGFTSAEIAKIMQSSEGTAKSQLFKARLKIRDFIRSR